VLLTQVKEGFTGAFTPVRNSSAVSLTLVKLSKTVKAPLTGAVDTSEEFQTSINETGEASFIGVVDTSKAPNLSNISANNRQKLKLFLVMSIGTRRSSLKKETEAEKSHDTVPLRSTVARCIRRQRPRFNNCIPQIFF
jgi:hypothetical protein